MFPPTEPTTTFPYRVVGQVGEGAMGVVYRAEDLELGRLVAIKVIKPGYLSLLNAPEAHAAVHRFLQEARAAAALSHPGATTVHRVGTEGGWPFIAMEWLDGRTLEALLLQRKRLPIEQVAKLGIQVLAVLAAAHQAGVVHRDIKPANLMITRDGRIKVTDFGIARLQGSSLTNTAAGTVLGTPKYAAPEQLAGRAVDRRVDFYGLGGVLYEAACGRAPFEATSVFELMGDVQTKAVTPPSSVIPGLPEAFDAVIRRALAKRPEDRFASAREMALALQPLLAGGAATVASKQTPARPRVPTLVVDAQTSHALVAAVGRSWPARALGRQDTARLLERLLDRPLHAPAFCGAVEVPGAVLLMCDGLVHGAFDPSTGRTGDAVLESLPTELDATLHPVPSGADPRLVPLLASLLHPAEPRLSGLEASFVNLPELAGRLEADGFDGAMRFTKGTQIGFAIFSRGRHVLDVFGAGWPSGEPSPWEQWIGRSGAIASVEERRSVYPSLTFRRQLQDLDLDVVRPGPSTPTGMRTDTLADAQGIELRPRDASRTRLRRGDSTLTSLVTADPAYALARWLVADLGPQFVQHGRAARWKALVDTLPLVEEVRLHHALGTGEPFDFVTFTADGRLLHAADRVGLASAEVVARFVARAVAAKESRKHGDELVAAVLVAPRFDDAAITAYFKAIRAESNPVLSTLGALTHTEGYLRLGPRRGLHVLLVEEESGRRRPLMPG